VGLVACKFYWLEVNPKDSSLKRFPTLSKTIEVLGSDLCCVKLFVPFILSLMLCLVVEKMLGEL